jgi:hypothetical protein
MLNFLENYPFEMSKFKEITRERGGGGIKKQVVKGFIMVEVQSL